MPKVDGARVQRVARGLRWTARVAGSLVAGFWLFIGAMNMVTRVETWRPESFVLAALVVASALAMAIAWWYDGLGGTIVAVCGVAHTVFAYIVAGHDKGIAMLLAGVPLVIVGALFLIGWRLMEREAA